MDDSNSVQQSNNTDIKYSSYDVNNHPYLAFIRSLNCTECYKHLLLQEHPTIEQICIADKDKLEFFKLKTDFYEKFPKMKDVFKNMSEPSDCTIL
jgi:hypothetical protein